MGWIKNRGPGCQPGDPATVDGTRTLLEVYLFDFDEQIYGKHLQVSFLHKLRDEEKYDSLDTLKAQIQKDVNAARAISRIMRLTVEYLL